MIIIVITDMIAIVVNYLNYILTFVMLLIRFNIIGTGKLFQAIVVTKK